MAPFWLLSEDPQKKIDAGGGPPAPSAMSDVFHVAAAGYEATTGAVVEASASSDTQSGDLLIAQLTTHRAIATLSWFTNPFNGWAKVADVRNLSGQDHRMALFWKIADAGDAAGTGNDFYRFWLANPDDPNVESTSDQQSAVIHTFRGAEEPGTSLDFMFGSELNMEDASTDILIGDIRFDEDGGFGAALLCCFVANDITSTTITTPSHMTERYNDTLAQSRIVMSDLVVEPSTDGTGPNRFIQSAGTDWIAMSLLLRPDNTGSPNLPKHVHPKFRSISRFTWSTGTTITVEAPSDTVAGELLLMCIALDQPASGNVLDSAPTGWTLIGQSAGANTGVATYWKRATVADTGTGADEHLLDWTANGNQGGKCAIIRCVGFLDDTADSWLDGPAAVAAGTANPRPLTPLTTNNNDCLVVYVCANDSTSHVISGSNIDLGPTGEVIILKANSSAEAGLTIFVEFRPTAGAGGAPEVMGLTADQWQHMTFAIRAA